MGGVTLGLLGHPVAHSLSAVMHDAALADCGLDGRYHLYDVADADLPGWVDAVRQGAVDGLNVTIPHKIAAARLCDRLVGAAATLGVVNTLVRDEDGQVVGHNTDVSGLRRALDDAFPALPVAEGPVCVVGAGGAAHAAVLAAASFTPDQIRVANRTLSRAKELVARLGPVVDTPLVAMDRLDHAARHAVLLLQATSVGMGAHRDSPAWRWAVAMAEPVMATLTPQAAVMDLVYRPPVTPWCAAAHAAGHLTEGGLKMLVYQAIEAFQLWTGRSVEPSVMLRAAWGGLQAAGERDPDS